MDSEEATQKVMERVDYRVWSPLRAAYKAACDSMHGQATLLVREASRNPHFNVMREARVLAWPEMFEAGLLDGWEESAAKALLSSRRRELRRRKPLYKDSPLDAVSGPTNATTRPSRSEEMAVEWLQNRGLSLVRSLSRKARESVEKTLREGMREGWSIQRMTKEIRNVVGLNSKDTEALQNRSRRLDEIGTKPSKKRQDIERYREQLIKRRAEMIARTEVVAARNQGQLQAWKIMQGEGDVDLQAKRIWIPARSERTCVICMTLGAMPPISLDQPFLSPDVGAIMTPPAHPNCRCSMGLV